MIGGVTLFLAAAWQPAPPVPHEHVCALVTPGTDAVAFRLIGAAGREEVALVATEGSVWPAGRIEGSRRGPSGARGRAERFGFGGADGIVLELGSTAVSGERTATLLLRAGDRAGVPAAFGFCQPGQTDAAVVFPPAGPAPATEVAALDPRNWPESHCGLLLGDGRRMPLEFRIEDGNRVRMASPGLWSGRPVTANLGWATTRRAAPVGTFSRRGGPRGAQRMVIDEEARRAVQLIHFEQMGDPSAAAQAGYAICGYNGIVRRATIR